MTGAPAAVRRWVPASGLAWSTGAIFLLSVLGLTAACSSSPASPPAATGEPVTGPASDVSDPAGTSGGTLVPDGWVEQQVSFPAAGTTVYGSYLHPPGRASAAPAAPAALLIAGSGPTDRDGNSAAAPGRMDTLKNLADALASNGIASLRYDKLGSGRTGLGAFADHPDTVGVEPFSRQAAAALEYLSGQPGVDAERLSVYGHSEGALFALQLATGGADDTPAVHALGLLEPLSKRYLDLLTDQVTTQIDQQRESGQITEEQAKQALGQLRAAVKQVRTDGTVPPDLGFGLGQLFAPGSLTFLSEADAIDPTELAADLPATTRVFITCSDADIQVACEDVRRLADAVSSPDVTMVRLHGVSHVLKQDDSRSAANYGADLPFSPELSDALGSFIED